MNTAKIRRDALALWLQALRLPLTVAETVLKREDDSASWPAAIAFEKLEAAVKDAVGNLMRDDTLVGMAHLQRAEVAQREQALAKRADAEATRADARRTAQARTADLERQREQAERAADERDQRLEGERRDAEQQVSQKAARKKAAARKQAAARKEVVAKAATKAEAEHLRKKSDSLRAKKQAVDAQGRVLELDRKARAKKAARRAG